MEMLAPMSEFPYANKVMLRLADDGVPVRVIARGLNIPSDEIREALEEAILTGDILEIPRDDWPPGTKRLNRQPGFNSKESDADVVVACQRAMKLTRLEANILAVLIRAPQASKEVLHHTVEQQRQNRSSRPDNPEPTDPKIVDVVICKLRKRLREFKVEIKTIWGHGYYMDDASRAQARIVMAQVTAANEVQNGQSGTG